MIIYDTEIDSRYSVMNGNAREAIDFYQKALNAEVLFTPVLLEMPENPEYFITRGCKNLVSGATIKVGETKNLCSLRCISSSASWEMEPRITICIKTDDAERAKQMFRHVQAERDNLQSHLPEKPFSAQLIGSVIDKFGYCSKFSLKDNINSKFSQGMLFHAYFFAIR